MQFKYDETINERKRFLKNINKKHMILGIIIIITLIIFTVIGVNNKMNKNFVLREETLTFNKLPN